MSHVDFYDTICDIVGTTTERDNPDGAFPRRGKSIADLIGWSDRPRADEQARSNSLCYIISAVQSAHERCISSRHDRDLIAVAFAGSPHTQICIAPMPVAAPVSFGRKSELLDAVQGWLNSQCPHHGIMLKANKLSVGNGHQEINFLRDAVLRLTFDRRE